TALTRCAAALHADALTVADPRGDAHLHLARAHLGAAPLAVLALVAHDLAAPATGRAHVRERERALVDRDRAGTATGLARLGERSRLGAAPAAHRARRLGGQADRRGDA